MQTSLPLSSAPGESQPRSHRCGLLNVDRRVSSIGAEKRLVLRVRMHLGVGIGVDPTGRRPLIKRSLACGWHA